MLIDDLTIQAMARLDSLSGSSNISEKIVRALIDENTAFVDLRHVEDIDEYENVLI